MRVALVHDWLTGMRGGEKVLEALAELYPEAPIFTLVHVPGSLSPALESRVIHASFLDRLPFGRSRYRSWLPLFPAAIESFDLRGYELVISTSHAVAKGIIPEPGSVHVAYLHTPMRYLWDQGPEYRQRLGPLGRAALTLAGPWLRTWDAAAAARVDRFVANSSHVARRIERYYRRRADVIPPPVDTEFFTLGEGEPAGGELLIVSALVPYKNIELAIAAVAGSSSRLAIVGEGPMRGRLEALAGPEVRFCGRVDAAELRRLYRNAAALVMPGEEDFGIAAVEAQACGCPVIAYARGGCLESVLADASGVFFDAPSPVSLREAIDRASRIPFNRESVRDSALRFSKPRFLNSFQRVLAEELNTSPDRSGAGAATRLDPHTP